MDLSRMNVFIIRHKAVVLIALLVTLIIIFFPIPHKKDVDLEKLSRKEINILHWTTFWHSAGPQAYQFDSTTSKTLKCSILETGTKNTVAAPSELFDVRCRVTFDRTFLERSHAIVFHSYDLPLEGQGLPKEPRNLNQLWIYRQLESPLALYTSLDLKAYRNVFNWTMTYRRDSDVYFPYGYITPRRSKHIPLITGTNMLTNKSRLVAWIVSNCDDHSKRRHFVNELQKYIPVDIYGKCGDKKCPSLIQDPAGNCYDYVESTHKFYLSFENSLCVDYITEKFYNVLRRNMVPVVYGGIEPEEYLKIAPNHSFINARQFKSAEDLASYLKYLDKNDDEYLRYFKWKDEYEAATSEDLGWCNLCQRLYERFRRLEVVKEYKWYSDLGRWWNYRSGQSNYGQGAAPSCIPPFEIPPKKLVR